MTTASPSLTEAIGSTSHLEGLSEDTVTGYLKQRLNALQVTLLEAVTNRALTAVSIDTPADQREAQMAQFDKQVTSLESCIEQVQAAINSKA